MRELLLIYFFKQVSAGNNGDLLPRQLQQQQPAESAATQGQPAMRRRMGGRPKSLHKKAPPARRRSGASGQPPLKGRLWQFLLRLLLDPKHNPSIIRWEDDREGVFAFVDGQKVAKLWGEQKLNCQMNYEKMSRTMR